MTETPQETGKWTKRLPLIAIGLVAVIGAFTLRDYLSFEALAENREALIAFRDANYVLTVLAFMAAYVIIVAFSLPGAAIATPCGPALALFQQQSESAPSRHISPSQGAAVATRVSWSRNCCLRLKRRTR